MTCSRAINGRLVAVSNMKRLQAIRGNLPSAAFRWRLTAAGKEFSVTEPTLGTKVNQAAEHPGADGCYTTAQMTRVIYGDLWAERYNKLKAETAKSELETVILKGDFVHRLELQHVLGQIADGILQIVKSTGLSKEAQDDIRRQISSIPVVIKAAGKGQALASTNGAEEKRRGRPPKPKAAPVL